LHVAQHEHFVKQTKEQRGYDICSIEKRDPAVRRSQEGWKKKKRQDQEWDHENQAVDKPGGESHPDSGV
jgi:hypothetical protein